MRGSGEEDEIFISTFCSNLHAGYHRLHTMLHSTTYRLFSLKFSSKLCHVLLIVF